MKATIRCLLLAMVVGLRQGPCLAEAVARGQVVFACDFEASGAISVWSPVPRVAEGFGSKQSVVVEVPLGSKEGSAVVVARLPVEKVRGCTLYCSAMVRAEGVTAKPRPWNGIKVMAAVEAPSGKTWPQAEIETGSFGWKRVAFAARVPSDATGVVVCLGLEAVSGKVWFDDVKVSVGKAPVVRLERPTTGPVFKGHALPRLRGVMISPDIAAESLRALGKEWKANVIRWQLIRHARPGETITAAEYDRWLESELARLDAAIPFCREYGLMIVVDLHSPPGGKPTVSGYVGSDDRLFTEKACQDHFVEVWRGMAKRYLNTKEIWGYDIANEPVEDVIGDECDDWRDLAERTAKAIREIDPNRAIIVEPADWGGPQGLRDFVPIDVPNVVYSVHMYVPGEFTHQGVHGQSPPIRYPGVINGQHWDKGRLEWALKPVVDFQKTYGVHVYIGEFSAIRWAPDNSAYRYLSDVIDIFENHGWDWSYHAFREWQGWSVEHTEERENTKPSAEPTDREKLLRGWFAQNAKPPQ